ncbi:MAG: hypothetical protein J6Y66_02555 [Bacteroidales bacterium]|nr:hypothetical protein [Bacteroidales bacterium]
MKKTYYAPQTEEFMINLEQGFLVGSAETDDTGLPGLEDPGLGDIVWTF